MGQVGPQQLLNVVRVAEAGLAPLDIDDGAKAAQKGAAAAGIEGARHGGITARHLGRQIGQGLTLEPGQLGHEVVDGLQAPLMCRAQQVREVLLRLAGEEGDAQIQRLLQLPGQVREHGQTAADMKTADRHLQARLAEAARQVQGAGVLVGLDPHQADQPLPAAGLEAADDPRHRHHGVGLVIGLDADLHLLAEHPPLVGGAGQPEEAGQGIRGNPGLDPLNDVTLVVVMEGLISST
jgi:hypothetical protein